MYILLCFIITITKTLLLQCLKENRELIEKFLAEFGFDTNSYNKMKRNIKKIKALFETELSDEEKQYAVLLKGLLHKCDYSASAGLDCEKVNDF